MSLAEDFIDLCIYSQRSSHDKDKEYFEYCKLDTLKKSVYSDDGNSIELRDGSVVSMVKGTWLILK